MYQDKYNASQLSLNTKLGLQRVYNILNKTNLNGLSIDDFANLDDVAYSDLSFSDLLKLNFNNLDTDKSQIVSNEELTDLLNSIDQKGLTYSQLQALSMQVGNSASDSRKLLDEVIQNFNKIDIDNDGKVSEAEINTYKLNKEVEDKEKELCEFKASDITIFYADNNTSSTESTETDSDTTSKNTYGL